MIWGPLPVGPNSVTTPLVRLMRPIWLTPFSANHRLPSGPAVMPAGLLLCVGMGNSVIVPADVIRPIRLTPFTSAPVSVNHRLPSGPVVMPVGLLLSVGIANSVIAPAGVIRPMRLTPLASAPDSPNQR